MIRNSVNGSKSLSGFFVVVPTFCNSKKPAVGKVSAMLRLGYLRTQLSKFCRPGQLNDVCDNIQLAGLCRVRLAHGGSAESHLEKQIRSGVLRHDAGIGGMDDVVDLAASSRAPDCYYGKN